MHLHCLCRGHHLISHAMHLTMQVGGTVVFSRDQELQRILLCDHMLCLPLGKYLGHYQKSHVAAGVTC